jgi:glycosyltransferase involved in cell wall biosynthesis
MVLNIIQDVATPHNNTLIKAIHERGDVKLNLWYAYDSHPQYAWVEDITNAIVRADVYGYSKVNFGLIRYVLSNPEEKCLIVGWANPTTRVLVLLLWLLRRPFNMWFDFPQDDKQRTPVNNIIRKIYFILLRRSRTKIFAAGKLAVNYFLSRGYPENRVVNLPIFIDVKKTRDDFSCNRNKIIDKYNITNKDLFISAGSRLIYEKGYDILIKTIGQLADINKNIKLVLVGKGEERDNLIHMVDKCNLNDNIFIEEWMDVGDYMSCIANSDVFVHPARFDAYGGTIFAMSLGVPVIGSLRAGAAIDRIEDGINGWLYNCDDTETLGRLISSCYYNKDKLSLFGNRARLTALNWKPETGAGIILKEAI